MVATEGETLPDNNVLTYIFLDGGVAINRSGQVAFGGQANADTVPAVFTQAGVVIKEGDTLEDGTTKLHDLSSLGEVAISVGPGDDRVAFHGRAQVGQGKADMVFINDKEVAVEGEPLGDSETIVHNIKPEGKVAINDFGEVAFHGKIEVEGGLIDEELRAVFNNEGVVAKEGDTLGDDITTVATIDDTGEVAINFLGEVAFHGKVVDPDTGNDTTPAVFTQEGLVAKVGDTLPDNNIVADIDENGGVAINFFGQVAFHGDVSEIPGGAPVPAVFTQNELVVKEGQTLEDGITIVDEIDQSGGVGIDFSGNVVFHGRTDGVRAVFTQHGVVAKEGDLLIGGTTLDEIHVTGGVAISEFGEIAFHGKVGTTDVVLVGTAP